MSPEGYIKSTGDNCPSCEREARDLQEFPRAKINSLNIIHPPKTLLVESGGDNSYDMAEALKEVFDSDQVQAYLRKLQESKGQIVLTGELLPPTEAIEVKHIFPWSEYVLKEEATVSLYSNRNGQSDSFKVGIEGIFGTGLTDLPQRYGYYQVHFDIVKATYDGFFLRTHV